MRGLNKVMLIGNLGKDPELHTFEGGNRVAKFSLATTESFKDKTGNIKIETEWHSIVVWGNLAEVAEKYLRKGITIYLEGKLKTRSYDDKDGNKKFVTEIIADNFLMLGKGSEKVEINASFNK